MLLLLLVVVEHMPLYRLAPLSEGRVESDGTLQCSYHGEACPCQQRRGV